MRPPWDLLPVVADGLFIAMELFRVSLALRDALVSVDIAAVVEDGLLDALADGVGWLSAFAAMPALAPVPELLALVPVTVRLVS